MTAAAAARSARAEGSGDDLTILHPVQTRDCRGGHVNAAVTQAAYEVFAHLYGSQESLVTGWCRGGFLTRELVAFLYARWFPKAEWRERVDEAFLGMENV